jgi:hypothetical protein
MILGYRRSPSTYHEITKDRAAVAARITPTKLAWIHTETVE